MYGYDAIISGEKNNKLVDIFFLFRIKTNNNTNLFFSK